MTRLLPFLLLSLLSCNYKQEEKPKVILDSIGVIQGDILPNDSMAIIIDTGRFEMVSYYLLMIRLNNASLSVDQDTTITIIGDTMSIIRQFVYQTLHQHQRTMEEMRRKEHSYYHYISQ